MSIVLDTVQPLTKAGRAERTYALFVRMASILCFVSTIGYWAGLSGASGFYGVAALGTDQVSVSALDVLFAVMFPVAMLGLWLRARWGVAVWVGLLLMQIFAHAFAPTVFGERLSLVIVNLVLLALLTIVGSYLIYSRYVAAESMSQ